MNPTRRELLAAAAALPAALALPPATRAAMHLPHADPADIGFDPKQLRVAFDLLDTFTAAGDIPGGAILVGRNGKVVAPHVSGKAGTERDAPPVRTDSMFLLASITKPVVYTAAMKLVERGRLNLTDKVIRHLPEFVGKWKDTALVRHLFTHTSGLPDMPPGNAELRQKQRPLSAFVDAALGAELAFKPGTAVSYQSCGTLLVAEIIRRLSGMPVADFLKKEIFDPLGLKSTALGAAGFPREQLVRVQLPDYQTDPKWGWNGDYWRNLGAPWGGMFSTAEDFAVICQALLAKGTWGGVKLLSPASVRAMTTNRLHDEPNLPEAVARTEPWGLGWRLNHPGTSGSWGDLLGPAVFGHTGATGTTVWMDPQTSAFCILLTNAIREKAPWRLVHLSNAVAAAVV